MALGSSNGASSKVEDDMIRGIVGGWGSGDMGRKRARGMGFASCGEIHAGFDGRAGSAAISNGIPRGRGCGGVLAQADGGTMSPAMHAAAMDGKNHEIKSCLTDLGSNFPCADLVDLRVICGCGCHGCGCNGGKESRA